MPNDVKRTQQPKKLRPHRTRDEIVDTMRSYGQPLSPIRLAEITGHTLGSIAHHVRAMSSAGILDLVEEVPQRGALEHRYVLSPGVGHESNMDVLADLQKLCGALTLPTKGGYPEVVVLDEPAREALQILFDKLQPKVVRIVQAAAARQPARPMVVGTPKPRKRRPNSPPATD